MSTNIQELNDQHREEIANYARNFLDVTKQKYPEVQFLTLTLKHLYGVSTLRVYAKRPTVQERFDDDPTLNPLAE
jgi:hypothetical protein